MKRFIALTLLGCFTVTVTTEGRSYASHLGGPAAGGSAGGPAGKILESFHSDLSTGRAVFGIPLATPPGRRGVQPAIGLSYSSAAKNGPVGVGWALELGEIQRSTRFGVPKFDSTDTFTVQAGGATGDLVQVAPGEYRPKDEQAFSRILFNGTSWTVTAKDGTTATFGGTPDSVKTTSRGVVAWLANQVQDIHGNTMTITYQVDGRHPYPASILYTAHPATGLAAQREVRFTWEPRPDKEWDERFGDRIEMNLRLQKVECFYQNALVRRYALTYTQSPITGRSMLSSVTTVGSDGQTSLPPVRLSYSDSFSGWTSSTAWSDPDNSAQGGTPFYFIRGGKDTGYRFEDADGDGLPDLMDGSAQLRTWINTNSGTRPWRREKRWAPPFAFIGEFGEDLGARSADLNGDGRTDFYYGHPSAGLGGSAHLNNTGTGWVTDWRWTYVSTTEVLYFIVKRNDVWIDNGMRFIELNGDGKTDLLQADTTGNRRAWLNTGAGWRRDDRWAPPFNFVFDDGKDSGCRFADLNGDGVTDLFYAGRDEQAAYLNTGTGWKRDTSWSSGLFQGKTFVAGSNLEDLAWRLYDTNGDGLVDLVQAREEEPFKVLLNTGTGWVQDASNRFNPPYPFTARQGADMGARFADLNGDGINDFYYGRSGEVSDGKGYCWASAPSTAPAANPAPQATPPDLLTRVENGVGGTTTLSYVPSTQYDNSGGDGVPDLPFVTQTVASQTISNGLGWSAATRFTYAGAKFNATEREFLGFDYAKATDPIGTTAESWFHQDVHLKGRPYKQETKDAAGNLYGRSENAWACTDLTGGGHFCHLAATTSTVFDGDATSRQTKVSYAYDAYGNVLQQVEEGDLGVAGDERTTVTEYLYNQTPWLMAHPSHVTVTDAAGNKLSESWVCYDGAAVYTTPPTRGLPTKTEAWLSTGPANPAAGSTYDAYGNRITSTDPLGRITTTAYDPAEQLFPVTVTNALSHSLQTTYDPATGAILSTTDPNGQVTQNRYDALGRLTAVVGPEDTDAAPGVRYEYDLSSLPTRTTKHVRHSAGGYYTSHSFADGLGRVIQTRSPAQDPAQQIVSGGTELGPRGETTAQYLPHSQPASASYSAPTSGTPKVLFEYDAIGRHVKTTDPDGAVSSIAYSDWTVTATDANGNSTVKESDAYGRLIKITEPATADHAAAVTTYGYDPAGRLTQVTDAKGNITRVSYDSLGRKTSMDDPDMAHWIYEYDAGGNLTRQTDAKGQVLEFLYDALNRMTQKIGRPSAGAAATVLASYSYDATLDSSGAPKPNGVGRLSRVTDPSGSTEFWYDLLGREVKTVKVIAGSSFTVQREYDPLNRLTRLLYPDGTDLRYEYSPQGIARIYSMNADSSTVDYLTHANYNAAGETLRMELGNGVATDYAYDPNTLRIAGIRTANSLNQTLQDFSYGFDNNGNLTALTDRTNTATQTSLQYDALNRLTQASGAYGVYNYRFDPLGNLLEKDNGITMTYGLADGSKPHAVTSRSNPSPLTTNDSLSYDPNGNLLQKADNRLQYDLENRLTEVQHLTSAEGSIPYALKPGWNLIAIPFDKKGESFPGLLNGIQPGSGYDQLSTQSANRILSSSHLTDHNTVTSTAGVQGKTAQFTRANQEYLGVADNPALSMGDVSFSVSCWVRADSLPDFNEMQTILGKGNEQTSPAMEYWLFVQNVQGTTRFRWVVGNNASRTILVANAAGTPSADTWYHIVAWHDAEGDQVGITVNAQATDTAGWTGGSYDSSDSFVVGRELDQNVNFWNGRIDEVGIWRHALTAQERADLYNGGQGNTFSAADRAFTVDAAGTLPEKLVAYYNLNELSGTRADSAQTVTRPWRSFVNDARFNEFAQGGVAQAYEIYVTHPAGVTFTLTGKTPAKRVSQPLVKGWNLIPSPVLEEKPAAQALTGLTAGTDYDELIRYDPATKIWEAVSTCLPGEAYWVHCLKSKNWTIPTPLAPATSRMTYDGDGGRVQLVTPEGTTTFIGQMYETLSGGATRTHIFFGPTRLATLEHKPILTARANGGSDPGTLGSDPTGFRSRFSRAFARLDDTLTRATPRKIRRAFATIEEFFVGKSYADTTLPTGTTLHFYHGDHLGSVNVLTDHTGAQVRLQEFAPFGKPTRGEGTVDTPHKFTGKRLDESTGLYYYGARYYDPELGRFIQPDSIVQAPSDPQTLNRYTYVRNNPLIYTDPTGHFSWKKVKSFFKKVGDFISPLGRAIVTGEWKHFGIQMLNIVGMVFAPNRNLSTILRHSGQSFTVQKASSTRCEEAGAGLLIQAAVGTSGGFGMPLGNRSG